MLKMHRRFLWFLYINSLNIWPKIYDNKNVLNFFCDKSEKSKYSRLSGIAIINHKPDVFWMKYIWKTGPSQNSSTES